MVCKGEKYESDQIWRIPSISLVGNEEESTCTLLRVWEREQGGEKEGGKGEGRREEEG